MFTSLLILCISFLLVNCSYDLDDMRFTRSMTIIDLSLTKYGPHSSSTPDCEHPQFQFSYMTKSIAEFKIIDPQTDRWEVPDVKLLETSSSIPTNPEIDLEIINTSPFEFSLTYQDGSNIVSVVSSDNQDSSDYVMTFEDQFLQLTFEMTPKTHMYGLGIRQDDIELPYGSVVGLFNRDPLGAKNQTNLYSTHPTIVCVPDAGKPYALMFINSNAMDFTIPSFDNGGHLIWRSIGGVVDVLVIVGDDTLDVIRQTHSVIGHPMRAPKWALGVGQCSWEYYTVAELEDVVEGYDNAGIPLDNLWSDITAWDGDQDFLPATAMSAAEMVPFLTSLHAKNRHYMQILDPAQHAGEGNAYAQELIDSGLYVRCPLSDGPIASVCWPGLVVAPDFSHPDMTDLWTRWIHDYHAEVALDGIWADMSEMALFNELLPLFHNPYECDDHAAYSEPLNRPPYRPELGGFPNLADGTLDMGARHHLGKEYDVHNMNGFYESIATYEALLTMHSPSAPRRPMLLTRSTYLGSGRVTGTWLGDNHSDYVSLASSIPMLKQASLHGLPMAGPDLGGFMGDAWADLVEAWYAVGCYYPLLRNHYQTGSTRQEPFRFGEEIAGSVGDMLRYRYTLLPFLDSVLAAVSRHGGSVWNHPAWVPGWEGLAGSPHRNSLRGAFVLGEYLFVTAITTDGEEHDLDVPLTPEPLFALADGTRARSTVRASRHLPSPAFLRAGAVIPRQQAGDTLAETSANPTYLTAAPAVEGWGVGACADGFEVTWDDGEDASADAWESVGLLSLATPYDGEAVITHRVDLAMGSVPELPPLTGLELLSCEPGAWVSVNGQAVQTTGHDNVCAVELPEGLDWRFDFVIEIEFL
eukprot:gnl/Dysnectes_brevis/2951_a3629_187.p1 GENE.gnl/Dysnectes_brevis/2951_a3629_187~~gnl/Dysnectes_brevis/2951_a3629_187.p1  ORF type:complete len:862 (+),score=155.17 gnl/Dysnectes_brevis/2951_a3629_187:194-2779(+)